jgi:hypothetical protein
MNITRKMAIETMCWECQGHYSDGYRDCENPRCPLYSFSPRATMSPDLKLFAYNPRRVGMVPRKEGDNDQG